MQIWLDTVNLEVVRDASICGIISGVTTNPSILAQAKQNYVKETLDSLLTLQDGPVAVQVTEEESAAIVEEAKSIFAYSLRKGEMKSTTTGPTYETEVGGLVD